MKSQWLKEYKAGFESGRLHNDNDVLCRDNLRKAEIGIKAAEPLIQAYWKGYIAGLGHKNEQTY